MVTTNFWLVGTSALGVVICGLIFGIFSLYKAAKLKQNMLRNFGFMMMLMGLLLLGPATDFLLVLFTGNNIEPLGLYGILSYMWVAPALILSMYLGGVLLVPKAKWYIAVIYAILGIIFEFILFYDYLFWESKVIFELINDPLGKDIIDTTFNKGSLAFILIAIFILSTLLFDGIGTLRKSFQLSGELKKKFLYLAIGFFLFTIAAVMDALLEPGPLLFIARFGFIADNFFLYAGIK